MPTPSVDSTETSPPWLLATWRTIARPRPVPPVDPGPGTVDPVEALEHAVEVASGDADPGVLDRQVHEVRSSGSTRRATWISEPSGEYFTALSSRLNTADTSWRRSPIDPTSGETSTRDLDAGVVRRGGDAALPPRPRPTAPRSRRTRRRRRTRCGSARAGRRRCCPAGRPRRSCARRVVPRPRCRARRGSSRRAGPSAPIGVFSSWLMLATKSRRTVSVRVWSDRSSTIARRRRPPLAAERLSRDDEGLRRRAEQLDLAAHGAPGERLLRAARSSRGLDQHAAVAGLGVAGGRHGCGTGPRRLVAHDDALFDVVDRLAETLEQVLVDARQSPSTAPGSAVAPSEPS